MPGRGEALTGKAWQVGRVRALLLAALQAKFKVLG